MCDRLSAAIPLRLLLVLPHTLNFSKAAHRGLTMASADSGSGGEISRDQGARVPRAPSKDSYGVVRDDRPFAGVHLLIDMWGAMHLKELEFIDQALRNAAKAAGASVLHSYYHQFSSNGGISGTVILAESHMSIHTWPELKFAAFDVFMCGACNPRDTVPVLNSAFSPASTNIREYRRGAK